MISKLHYFVSNCGDGSVAVRFCKNETEAKSKDNEQEEGYAESTADFFKLKIENNSIYCFHSYYDYDKKVHVEEWVKLNDV